MIGFILAVVPAPVTLAFILSALALWVRNCNRIYRARFTNPEAYERHRQRWHKHWRTVYVAHDQDCRRTGDSCLVCRACAEELSADLAQGEASRAGAGRSHGTTS